MSSERDYRLGSDDEQDDEEEPTPPETVLVQNTFDKNHLSVVRILIRGGTTVPQGSGFVVHNDGASCLVLTCHHVIVKSLEGNMQVYVKSDGMGNEVAAQVMHSSKDSDLALLRVSGGAVPTSCSALEFSNETDLSGSNVVVLGYFGLDDSTVLTTPASAHGMIMSEPVRQSEFLESIICNYTSESGTSGGPVIMDEEMVVGVNFESGVGMRLAVTAWTVKMALKRWIWGGDENEAPEMAIKEMLQLLAGGGGPAQS